MQSCTRYASRHGLRIRHLARVQLTCLIVQESDTDLDLDQECLSKLFAGPIETTIDLAKRQLASLATKCSKVR
jgi:hypothetical protein